MDILLIGHEGQVAWELRRTLACLGRVVALGRTTQPALDLHDSESIRQAVRTRRPNLIVNAAAYTAVDKAEQEPDAAHRINAEAVGVLAEAAREVGAALIHYSTDYVFPGAADRPYREDDATGPLGVYGLSKLQGEDYIRQVGAPHLILRTAWVYGGRGGNFLLTMLRLMRERESLGIVDDQHGAPTWSRMIAETTALLAARCYRDGRFDTAGHDGVYHLTSAGETTWFGFASRIRELAIEQGLLSDTAAALKPIPTSAYPTPAQRPHYSVLSNEKLRSAFGLALPHWDDALKLCLADMAQA
ncbi:MAG: dTDP-4-dehydrorhamnose reductase [Methylococcus sp.]